MTRKSKPPTNREMRAIAEHNVQGALDTMRSSFDAALCAYENALVALELDRLRLSRPLRERLEAHFKRISGYLEYLASIRFVERYPDNDEPVKDA